MCMPILTSQPPHDAVTHIVYSHLTHNLLTYVVPLGTTL